MPMIVPNRDLRLALLAALALTTVSGACSPHRGARTDDEGVQSRPTFPPRVLITNDNGIDDPKLVALARAFAERAETWVVAPDGDRSGGGAHLTIIRTGSLAVEERQLGAGIRAYAVDGYPADAVLVAVLGLMRGTPPDLVVSGINGGPNLGGEWMHSGTVGAARIAALGGIPAIAVSGLLRDELPGAMETAADWVVRLAGSDAVAALRPGDYLTVSLPPDAPEGVRGVRITERAGLPAVPRLSPGDDGTWRVVGVDSSSAPVPAGSDVAAWLEGYIAVVPMSVDEVDRPRLEAWSESPPGLPRWSSTP